MIARDPKTIPSRWIQSYKGPPTTANFKEEKRKSKKKHRNENEKETNENLQDNKYISQ